MAETDRLLRRDVDQNVARQQQYHGCGHRNADQTPDHDESDRDSVHESDEHSDQQNEDPVEVVIRPARRPSPPRHYNNCSPSPPNDNNRSPPPNDNNRSRSPHDDNNRSPSPDDNNYFGGWILFYFFCFLSGQYINIDFTAKTVVVKTLKIVVSVAGLLFFGLQFLLYLGHVASAVGVEVSRIGKVGVMMEVNSTNCGMTSCPIGWTIFNSSTNCTTCAVDCTLPDEHWKFSTAITIGSIASFFSFSLLTCLILIPLNGSRRGENTTRRFCKSCGNFFRKNLNYFLSPFNDTFKLQPIEMACFYIKYIIVHFLFICCSVFSIWYVVQIYNATKTNETVFLYNSNKPCWNNIFNRIRISLHLVSLFCSIQSCFIFSKVVYKATHLMNKLSKDITDLLDFVQPPNINDTRIVNERVRRLLGSNNQKEINKGRFIWLQNLDQHFINDVEPTLNLFGIWFIVHWVLYALTTMLLTGYILRIVMDIAEGDLVTSRKDFLPNTCSIDTGIAIAYVFYIVSFTLIHAYLFLYPCFRASAIAVARAKLIHDVSTKQWENVSPSLQTEFVNYLTTQNFAFRVPLFCATIPFGFNWVYVSFFVAICGAYLRM